MVARARATNHGREDYNKFDENTNGFIDGDENVKLLQAQREEVQSVNVPDKKGRPRWIELGSELLEGEVETFCRGFGVSRPQDGVPMQRFEDEDQLKVLWKAMQKWRVKQLKEVLTEEQLQERRKKLHPCQCFKKLATVFASHGDDDEVFRT